MDANLRDMERAPVKKAKFSEKDSRGYLQVDCTECRRGCNGPDAGTCAGGMRAKKGGMGACFNGELIDGITVD